MDTTTIAHPAPRPTPETAREQIAAAVERELERVRAARPALASRVSRAENILVTHLSCRRARMIRVRVRDGVRPRFLVSGSGGAVYVVDPVSWGCTCPDHHRRGAGCKHSIAAWALWRASALPALPAGEDLGHHVAGLRPCAGCGERFAGRQLVEVGPEEAEWTLAVSEGERYCRPNGCARHQGLL